MRRRYNSFKDVELCCKSYNDLCWKVNKKKPFYISELYVVNADDASMEADLEAGAIKTFISLNKRKPKSGIAYPGVSNRVFRYISVNQVVNLVSVEEDSFITYYTIGRELLGDNYTYERKQLLI